MVFKTNDMDPDGGGVRSLDSLLIFQEPMNKIGDEEKIISRADGCAESSFAPGLYKPTRPRRVWRSSAEDVLYKEDDVLIATLSDGLLPNSSLFLPSLFHVCCWDKHWRVITVSLYSYSTDKC